VCAILLMQMNRTTLARIEIEKRAQVTQMKYKLNKKYVRKK